MKIFCEIFQRALNSSSRLNGACFQYINQNSSIRIESNQAARTLSQIEDREAALFVIIVVCFYSLSIFFMVIANIKFNFVIEKDLNGRLYCWYKKKNDWYETQREETKNTIHIIFNESSKLLTSVAAITPDQFDQAVNI